MVRVPEVRYSLEPVSLELALLEGQTGLINSQHFGLIALSVLQRSIPISCSLLHVFAPVSYTHLTLPTTPYV